MERLVELVQRRARERAQRFVGRTMEVLVEGPSRTDPSRLRGRTRHNKAVNFEGTGAARRAGRGRDHRGDLDDADRARAAAQPRRLSAGVRSPRDLRPDRGRQDRVSRSSSPSCCASGARTRSRSPATRSRSTEGLEILSGAATRGASGRGSSTACSDSCRRRGVLGRPLRRPGPSPRSTGCSPRAAGRSSSAAPASTCARRSPSSSCARRCRPRSARRSSARSPSAGRRPCTRSSRPSSPRASTRTTASGSRG